MSGHTPLTNEQKLAIMDARGQSAVKATGAKRYEIRLSDGRTFTCIDLVNDPPEEVEKGIHEMFGHYGVTSITR